MYLPSRVVPATLTALTIVLGTSTTVLAASVGSTPVGTIVTSTWTPPSPDPSGITWNTAAGELIVSDGEVDEMPLYAGANLFGSSTLGVQSDTGTTLPWSNEPTGIGYNPDDGHLFVSDDDKKSVFEIAGAGPDGTFGTADDGAVTSFKTSTFGNTDPEDVAYDSVHNRLLTVDGVGARWFVLAPGVNGSFDGVAPGGDDIATEFSLQPFGAIDPEGITFDEVRETVLVVDGSADLIFELDLNGSLLNEIDISSANIVKAAGIVVAPASSGGGRHYYIVDRGLDNNSHPGENDGLIHEVSATLQPITNRPPAASAGVDQLMDVTETASLVGNGVDDGLPSGTLTYGWTTVSGPGTVTFGTPGAAATSASFSAAGTYVLRLTVSDSELEDSDDVVVQVFEPGAVRTVTLPIVSGADDAQEGGGTGGLFVDLSSADNELGNDGPPTPEDMLTGLRFADIPIPAGGQVVSARIQFQTDEMGADAATFRIRGEAADDAAGYLRQAGNISSRTPTTTSAAWSPPPWSVIGEAGADQQTPDLGAILQEIVDRPGWQKNNAAAFMFDGTGRRTAEAKDGLTPPVLVLEFRTAVPNVAPTVDAGPDLGVRLPNVAVLDATVTDDGRPAPFTTTWSMVSGPGTVTFGDASSQDTTASFSQPGGYTLRLVADDTALSAQDDVVVTVTAAPPVNVAPTVDAGPDLTVQLPDAAVLDATVTDDGLPAPFTTTWSMVSGPGTVTFEDASSQDTTASFSEPGEYMLRLVADDTALSAHDDVVATVTQADPSTPTYGWTTPRYWWAGRRR